MTFNTGNNVPSTSPRDLYDNSENVDQLMNGPLPFYADRTGKLRDSWAGMENAFVSAQESRESRFDAHLLATGYQFAGDYTAGVTLTERSQLVRSGGEYWRLAASAALPYVTTGAGMPEGGSFVSVGDAVLRQDLMGAEGAALVRYDGATVADTLTEQALLIQGNQEDIQAAEDDIAEVRSAPHASAAAPLRIAFHYNYENAPEKLERLKALGFNAVWVYRTAPWMGDIPRTLAFLDTLYRHGISAVIQPYAPTIAAGSGDPGYADEAAWIEAIEGHDAVIGFSTYDEPAGQAISPSLQQSFYTNIKTLTLKNVVCVDGTHTLPELDAHLWSSGYDVQFVDIYPTQQLTEDLFKKYFVRAMLNLMSYDGGDSPANKRFGRQAIPVLPMFSGEGFPKPTAVQCRWIADCWRSFARDSSYGIFAHDIESPDYETLDTSKDLRDLCSVLATSWGGRGDHSATLLTARSYSLNPSYVASVNMTPSILNGTARRWILGPASSADCSVDVLVQLPRGCRKLVLYAKYINRYDSASRGVTISVSANGTDFSPVGSETIGAAFEGQDLTYVYDVEPDLDYVVARYSVALSGTVLSGEHTGFYSVGAVPV